MAPDELQLAVSALIKSRAPWARSAKVWQLSPIDRRPDFGRRLERKCQLRR